MENLLIPELLLTRRSSNLVSATAITGRAVMRSCHKDLSCRIAALALGRELRLIRRRIEHAVK
jgi:hypothetical protein